MKIRFPLSEAREIELDWTIAGNRATEAIDVTLEAEIEIAEQPVTVRIVAAIPVHDARALGIRLIRVTDEVLDPGGAS